MAHSKLLVSEEGAEEFGTILRVCAIFLALKIVRDTLTLLEGMAQWRTGREFWLI